MKSRKKRRQRIDTMIDALVWMRRTAISHREWPILAPSCTATAGTRDKVIVPIRGILIGRHRF